MMNRMRFWSVLNFVFIVGLAMMFLLSIPVFAQSPFNDPNTYRTGSYFYGYPGFGYYYGLMPSLYSTAYLGFPQVSGISIDYMTPIGGFTSGQTFASSPFGGASSVRGELLLPWTYYGTQISTAFDTGAVPGPFGLIPTATFGISAQHEAFGIPTAFHMTGLHPDVAGQLALAAYAPFTAAMDRALGNVYMFTEQGMPFIAAASYYNPDSYGGSNWFFPAGSSSYEAEVYTLAGIPVAGYEGLYETVGYGILPAQTSVLSGFRAFAADAVSDTGISTSAFGGWSGTAGVFGTTSAAGMGLSGGTGAWSSGGTSTIGGGFVSGAGNTYGGTNVGWGGGGGGFSGSSGGVSGGFGGGGSMGGGSYGGAPGAGFGGAPAG
ncbi:MAG: hypothetical protein ACMUIM_07450 [bacterium]